MHITRKKSGNAGTSNASTLSASLAKDRPIKKRDSVMALTVCMASEAAGEPRRLDSRYSEGRCESGECRRRRAQRRDAAHLRCRYCASVCVGERERER
jgi:hypothetical protein